MLNVSSAATGSIVVPAGPTAATDWHNQITDAVTAPNNQITDAVTAPRPSAKFLEAVNTAVVGFFDSTAKWLSTLPSNPFSDLASGALLLVRRTLFNQLPSGSPDYLRTTPAGAFEGTIGAGDIEGDNLTYQLVTAPKFGNVQIDPDGTYRYVSAETVSGAGDFQSSDQFTVAISDRGFNVLNPLSDRLTEVTVNVGPDRTAVGPVGSPIGVTRGFDMINLTRYKVKLTNVVPEAGYDMSWVEAPPVNTIYNPGDGIHAEVHPYFFSTWDTRLYFTALDPAGNPTDTAWTVVLKADTSVSNKVWCESGNCSYAPGDENLGYEPRRILLTETSGIAPGPVQPLTIDIAADTPGGAELLSRLLDVSRRLPGSGLKPKYSNITVKLEQDLQKANATQPTVAANLDNPTSVNQGMVTVEWKAQTTAPKPAESPWWKNLSDKYIKNVLQRIPFVGDDVANLLTIDNVLGKPVSKSEITTPKSYSGTLPLAVVPYSVSEILVPGPSIYANGDLTLTLKTCNDAGRCASPGTDLVTWNFKNMDFDFPNPNVGAIKATYRTEPVQPANMPNVGFQMRDKAADTREPTYKVGQKVELYLTAFNSGNPKDGFSDFSAKSCNDTSATNCTTFSVDQAGQSAVGIAVDDGFAYLTGKAPGTAKVTATYNWSIPLGGGIDRKGSVVATMLVTVIPAQSQAAQV